MKIFVYRPDGNRGPYSPYDLQSLLKEGMLKSDDMGWHEGLAEWRPITTFLPALPAEATYTKPEKRTSTQARDEDTRREYIRHEESIRTVGAIYFIIAIFWLVMMFLVNTGRVDLKGMSGGTLYVVGSVLVGLCVYIGIGLRRLDPHIVSPASVVAVVGLLMFPLGTALNGYLLYLLHSEKGKAIFTAEYREVITATPMIKYEMSLLVKVFIVFVILITLDVLYATLYHPPPN